MHVDMYGLMVATTQVGVSSTMQIKIGETKEGYVDVLLLSWVVDW